MSYLDPKDVESRCLCVCDKCGKVEGKGMKGHDVYAVVEPLKMSDPNQKLDNMVLHFCSVDHMVEYYKEELS